MANVYETVCGLCLAAGAGGAVHAATVAATALTSVLARSPRRRRDARETLRILVRGRAR